MNTLQNSNDSLVIATFAKKKVLTINELQILIPLLSVRTIYTRLKGWNAITSYNKNGKFYTLTTIAIFDSYGLWHYNDIHFSKYGNLKQTLIHLIKSSENGLNALEIAELMRMDHRSFLSHFSLLKEIQRTKIDGIYIWFSGDADTCQRQKAARLGASKNKIALEIKDSIAILILVERVRNPEMELETLSELLSKQGVYIKPETIGAFFSYHRIEKKSQLSQP
jgi:hypothetical protein